VDRHLVVRGKLPSHIPETPLLDAYDCTTPHDYWAESACEDGRPYLIAPTDWGEGCPAAKILSGQGPRTTSSPCRNPAHLHRLSEAADGAFKSDLFRRRPIPLARYFAAERRCHRKPRRPGSLSHRRSSSKRCWEEKTSAEDGLSGQSRDRGVTGQEKIVREVRNEARLKTEIGKDPLYETSALR